MPFLVLFLLSLHYFTQAVTSERHVHSVYKCGARLTETRGYITTPNFPEAFPVPLACRWIFYAPPGKKVVLYFTEYYLRELYNMVEYDYYVDESENAGRYDVSHLRIQEDQIIFFEGYKPYVVLSLRVVDMGNLHIRVGDFLLDVYGFNITYEIMDADTRVRTDVCSVFRCSYLGRCIVDKDFENFECDCFDKYWGDVCQYGPFCNPPVGKNLCHNGGKCRYFWGSLVNTCECPPSYEGVKCEIRKKDHFTAECDALGCMHRCELDEDGIVGCVCDEGYKLEKDNKSCTIGSIHVYSEIRSTGDIVGNTTMECFRNAPNQLYFIIGIYDFSQNFEDLNISLIRTDNTSHYFSVYFTADKTLKKEVELFMNWIISRNISLCGQQIDSRYLGFSTELALPSKKALHSMTLVNYDEKPTQLGGLLTLVCTIQGPSKVQFYWFKDGAPINIHRTQRNLWETRIPSTDDENHISVLNIHGTVPEDRGVFSCVATDEINEEKMSIKMDIVPLPSIMIEPLQQSVVFGTSLTISCVSYYDTKPDFKYIWLKNGQTLHMGEQPEIIENIDPTGSRLKLPTVKADANYTCMVQSDTVGTLTNTSLIYVIKGGLYCPAQTHYNVSWDTTTKGVLDVKSCPGMTTGHAGRKCTCNYESCTWDVPSFSNCTSRRANSIYEMIVTTELGYGNYSMDETLSFVLNFTQQMNTTDLTVIGDLNLMARTLWKLQEYKSRYSLSESDSFLFKKMLNVLDFILDIMDNLSEEQEQQIYMMPYLFKILEYITDVPPYLSIKDQPEDVLHNIDYVADKRNVDNKTQPPVHLELHGVTLHAPVPVDQTDFYKMNFIAFTYKKGRYQNITKMNGGLFLNSMVVKISILKDNPPFMQDIPNKFTVKFQHNTYLEKTDQPSGIQKHSYCALWEFTKFPEGEWDLEECQTVEETPVYTTCECSWSGVYAVVNGYVTQENTNVQKTVNNCKFVEIMLLPVMGFVLYLFFYLALCTRNKQKAKSVTPAQLNFYVVMILFGIVLYNGSLSQTDTVICMLNSHAAEVLYLAALSSLTTEALTNFIKLGCHKLNHHNAIFNAFCLWAVPVVFVLSTTAEYLLHNSDKEDNNSNPWQCLPNRSDLTFLCCASIGVLLCIFLFCTQVAVTILSHKKSKEHLRFQIFHSIRYICTVILLNLLISSVVFRNTVPFVWTTTLNLMITLIIWAPVIEFNFQPEETTALPFCNICRLWWTRCLNIIPTKFQMKKSMSSSTFRAFIRPETLTSLQSKSDDSDEVFQRDLKYTLDHKAHLSSLLGNSSTEDSSRHSSLVEFPLLSGNIMETEVNDKPLKATCYIKD